MSQLEPNTDTIQKTVRTRSKAVVFKFQASTGGGKKQTNTQTWTYESAVRGGGIVLTYFHASLLGRVVNIYPVNNLKFSGHIITHGFINMYM